MSPLLDMALRLLLAIALGAIIGYQRERAGKAAGLRTHTLISLGAALFTVVSIFGFSGAVDPSRVAAGVVAGVGFIGAGVIFRGMGGTGVAGLTTAASIWTAAGVGLAAGAGMWLIAIIAGLAAVGILMIPKVHG
ncbi:MAG: magnesium transporter MgtC [Chloroflexi bacterium CG_4_10_14_0_8_um_filter_46_9]|nr:MAG: magnesium transporter MgtC [Dehalococcoidia bacterium CG2_30_46_19]PIW40060.1 MAG: magnesium transporter MgtC [Chloroflexi bacterium CG15_BIG_FIL_POST_REV_8_21_14_020_46_15]PIZ27223.1 MAG: magnesium transporter MgtC [Chloroflexi bacterium CG_4_10_14_0_8_um_filter_46_9]